MTRPTTWTAAALAAVTLTLAGTTGLDAQERRGDADWWRWALAEVLVDGDRGVWGDLDRRFDRDRLRRLRRARADRGRGPAFCRSGEGHPVHGRRWCVRKGFGLADVRWRRADLGDLLFRRAPWRDRAILDRGDLGGLLGAAVLERLLDRSRRDRFRAPLTGRWFEESGARVLQIRAGGRPLAELSDLDRDGVVDVLLRAVRD